MKKFIAFMVVCALGLFGCSSTSLPDGVSQTFYDNGKAVVEIMDDYFANDVTAAKAADKVQKVLDKLSNEDVSDSIDNESILNVISKIQSNLSYVSEADESEVDSVNTDLEIATNGLRTALGLND